MTKIFISYRRADTQHAVDRMYESMKAYVDDPASDIFIDIDGIPLGADFVEHIENRVAQCRVLFAVIGQGWADARDKTGNRRLDDSHDYVRLEIASALKRNIPVVPVFFDDVASLSGADLPDDLQPLQRRNGEHIRRQSFDADIGRLMTRLGFSSKPSVSVSPQLATSSIIPAGTELGTLKVMSGPDGPIRGRTFFIAEGSRLKIGRNPANDIVLEGDGMVSRTHCGVSATHGRLYVEDYQSANGTTLNNRRLSLGESAELANGDQIRISTYAIGVQILNRI